MTQSETSPLRVAVVGLGYFSQFHLRAWQRIGEAALVAVCDRDEGKVAAEDRADGRVEVQYPALYQAQRREGSEALRPARDRKTGADPVGNLERSVSDVQLLLAKPRCQRPPVLGRLGGAG